MLREEQCHIEVIIEEKCYNASRFASVGYNANGGPKCQRRAKILPSLKRLAVSRKILHQLALATAITITLIRHLNPRNRRP